MEAKQKASPFFFLVDFPIVVSLVPTLHLLFRPVSESVTANSYKFFASNFYFFPIQKWKVNKK